MRIGIDIDGVLTNIEQWQLDMGSKNIFEKYNKEIENANGYDLKEIFNIEESLDDEFWREYLFDYAENEPARKHSNEVTNKLKEDGNEIYIITARYLTDKDDENGKRMRNIVINWLKEYNIYYDKIIFSLEEKLDICMENKIDLMIEDKVGNINKISKYIPVICFDARYNQKCKGKNIYRCYSWYDIYAKVKNIIKWEKNNEIICNKTRRN